MRLSLIFLFVTFQIYLNDGLLAQSKNELFNASYKETLETAKAENKLILLQVHSTSCKYCKLMEKQVFTDDSVRVVINEGYSPFKIFVEDADSLDIKGYHLSNAEVAYALGIKGYPSTVILNNKEQLINIVPGYMDKNALIEYLKAVQDAVERHTTEQ